MGKRLRQRLLDHCEQSPREARGDHRNADELHRARLKATVFEVARTVRPQELAAAYHVDSRLFTCCVTLGREAFDTRSNADEVARWLQRWHSHSIRLVTNDIHMRRARFEIEKRVGADVTIVSDAVPTDSDMRQIFIEYNKYLLGRAAGLVGI